MKKSIFTFLGVLSLGATVANAQHACGFDIVHKNLLQADPQLQEAEQLYNARFNEFLKTANLNQYKSGGLNKKKTVKYIIPVVFHVLHNNGSENISDAKIKDEITILNEFFSGTSAFSERVRPVFSDILADVQIEFRLAKKDPNGACTNGINRVVTPLTVKGNDDVKKLIGWDPQRYLNVWVVQTISINSSFPVGGYAYKPTSHPGSRFEGLMAAASSIGNISTINADQRNTVTHEIGHYLGLDHPFNGDSCDVNGDFVDDTPPVYFKPNAVTFTRNECGNLNYNSCSADNPDLPDQYENIMDYFSGPCSGFMFTLGQAARMHFTLDNYRKNLWSAENLVATGVNETGTITCAPKASFSVVNMSELGVTCTGSSLLFKDNSHNATVTGWQWNFGEGATPATFSGQNPPAVIYATPGKKTVSLTASNTSGENTYTATNFIEVSPVAAASSNIIYADWDYENNFLQNGWVLHNEAGDAWKRTNAAAYSGSHSLMVEAISTRKGFTYSLISPSYDFSQSTTPYLSFYYSFAANDAGNNFVSYDALKVYISKNCGQTWQEVQSVEPTQSVTTTNPLAGFNPTLSNMFNFVPINKLQWNSFNLPAAKISKDPNIRFKIAFTNQGGNNFYIDELVSGFNTSTKEVTETITGLSVYPNPSSGDQVNLNLQASAKGRLSISVLDITGKKVADITNREVEAGSISETIHIRENNLSTGVYLIQVEMGGSSLLRKLVVSPR